MAPPTPATTYTTSRRVEFELLVGVAPTVGVSVGVVSTGVVEVGVSSTALAPSIIYNHELLTNRLIMNSLLRCCEICHKSLKRDTEFSIERLFPFEGAFIPRPRTILTG